MKSKWYQEIIVVVVKVVIRPVALGYFAYDAYRAWREGWRMSRRDAVLEILRDAWPQGLFGLDIFKKSKALNKSDKTFPLVGSYSLLHDMEAAGWIRSERHGSPYGPRLVFYLSGRRRPSKKAPLEVVAVLDQDSPAHSP